MATAPSKWQILDVLWVTSDALPWTSAFIWNVWNSWDLDQNLQWSREGLNAACLHDASLRRWTCQRVCGIEASGRNQYRHVTELWHVVKGCIRTCQTSTSRGKQQTETRRERPVKCSMNCFVNHTDTCLSRPLAMFVYSRLRTKTNQLLQCGQTSR